MSKFRLRELSQVYLLSEGGNEREREGRREGGKEGRREGGSLEINLLCGLEYSGITIHLWPG